MELQYWVRSPPCADCDAVTDVHGERWALTLQAAPLYRAVFPYNADQVSGSLRHCPKLERSAVGRGWFSFSR